MSGGTRGIEFLRRIKADAFTDERYSFPASGRMPGREKVLNK